MTGKIFRYVDYTLDEQRIVANFRYTLETSEQTFDFTESLTFPESLNKTKEVEKLLQLLHIGLGISYYKSFIPPKIEHPYEMTELDAGFWNSVFLNGLGEFLYKNKLDVSLLAKFSAQSGTSTDNSLPHTESWKEKAILGIGGGKDSIVAGEMLKNIGVPISGFVLATGENTGQAEEVTSVMNVPTLIVKRRLDPKIIDINSLSGAYNGHVPISLIFALAGCVVVANRSEKFVVVANESSASIPQVIWGGKNVNHQWSKSIEFENLFQNYIHHVVSPELTYFSAIRSLSSVAVAKLFARLPEYFEVFTSDNGVFKIDSTKRPNGRWSIDSPKTLSSFLLIAPYLDDAELLKIFGTDIMERPELSQLLVDLLGASDTPVLDCVGTPEELRLSLSILVNQNRYQTSPLVKTAKEYKLLVNDVENRVQNVLEISANNALPPPLKDKILKYFEEKLA